MTDAKQKLLVAMDAVATMVETHGIAQKGGRKYVQVVHRVEQLRRAYDVLASIQTKILVDDGERVLMIATVRIGENVIGTGHAEELRGVGYVNKTSAIENCETSAIGRALAACGLAGGEYASMNELDGVVRKEEAQRSKPSESERRFTKEEQTQKFDDIVAWMDSGDATEKQLAGMLARSAELQALGQLTTRQQRKVFVECLIRTSEWDDAQAFLVKMQQNTWFTEKQIAEYMARVDAGRGGAA